MAAEFVKVAKVTDVASGEAVACEVGDREIALCNVDGEFYAVENVCTHDDGELTGGHLEDHAIVCPRHGARFDVRTGEVLRMPASFPIRTYTTKIENGTVYVKVDIDE